MTVRIAIIGAGIMGADHARILVQDVPGVALHVVCDASQERARAVADACSAADVSTDPLATIDRNDVDAILIASPDDTHAPLARAAIAAGKPVLCEKPLSQSPDDCLSVIEAETAHGQRLVQVGFMRRFDPCYREMKDALLQGLIGKPIMMHNFHRNVEALPNFTGKMAITNSAPHEFDVARFILDADYRAVSVFQPSAIDTSKAGAPVFMVLETDAGQLVNIEINNNAAYGYDVRGELVGETGSILLNTPVHTRINSAMTVSERYAPDWRPRFAQAYRLQNIAFVRFVQTGLFPDIASDAWDGYRATVVAAAAVEALERGQRILIPHINRPALYA